METALLLGDFPFQDIVNLFLPSFHSY